MELDLTGVGGVLVGLAALIGALVSGYASIRNSQKIRDIDHAVNGKPEGALTMQKQVAALYANRPPDQRLPEELSDAAITDMLRLLVADVIERRNGK